MGFIPWLLLGLNTPNVGRWVTVFYIVLAFFWILPPWGSYRRKFETELALECKSIMPSLMLGLMVFYGALLGSVAGNTMLPGWLGFQSWNEKLEQLENGTKTPEGQSNPNFQTS